MAWMSTKSLVVVAALGVFVPMLLLVGRIMYSVRVEPAPPDVLMLDAAVLGAGVMGIVAMLGLHLQSAFTRPLVTVQERLEGLAAGRYDEACPAAGPDEIRALAHSVAGLGQAMERRLHEVTQQSGVLAIGTILNGVAHEVANPLASMHLSMHMLLDEARRGQPSSVDSLARVSRGVSRLEEVVKTLRQTAGERGEYEPDRIVQASLIVAQQSLLSSNLDTQLDAKQRVACVPGEIVQALVALLRNAGESGAGSIDVRTRDEPGFVAFEVEDDGCGIPKEIESQADQPFVTSKKGHAGLGLHHAQSTAASQGGDLRRFRSETGTRVVLRLPVADTSR